MSSQVISPNHTEHSLSQKAQECLKQATEIPGAPLYHMGNIAIFNSKDSYDLMQATINYLTCKAQIKITFNDAEKTFLIELYESFWWGGMTMGMPEAARLAKHYIHGKGIAASMDSKPYEQSVVVQDTIVAMKAYIIDLANRNEYFFTLKSDDPKFKRSLHFKPLMLINGSRNKNTQGYVYSDGTLFAEGNNQRLKKSDHRFYLKATSNRQFKDNFVTTWSVDNRYDFEPFSRGDKYTDLPFPNGKTLLLPDGLSEYMDTGLGIAKAFNYSANWTEIWK